MTVMFGAMCAVGIHRVSVRHAVLASGRKLIKHDGWWAIPAMIATGVAVSVVVPGAVLAGPLGAVAASRLGGPHRSGYVTRTFGRHVVVGLLPCLWSLAIWLVTAIVVAMRPPEIASLAAAIAAVFAWAVVVAWFASSTAQLFLDDIGPTPAWPPPIPYGTIDQPMH